MANGEREGRGPDGEQDCDERAEAKEIEHRDISGKARNPGQDREREERPSPCGPHEHGRVVHRDGTLIQPHVEGVVPMLELLHVRTGLRDCGPQS